MRVLLVGQAPSRTSDPKRPLAGEPLASRLAAMCGLSVEEYLAAFDRVNLLPAWPGKSAKGDLFPIAEARAAATSLKSQLLKKNRRVVFLGRNVACAFGWSLSTPYLKWESDLIGRVAIFPHPSGVNRFYNDPRNRRRAAAFLKSCLWLEARVRAPEAIVRVARTSRRASVLAHPGKSGPARGRAK